MKIKKDRWHYNVNCFMYYAYAVQSNMFLFSARCVHRTNHRVIVILSVRLSVCPCGTVCIVIIRCILARN